MGCALNFVFLPPTQVSIFYFQLPSFYFLEVPSGDAVNVDEEPGVTQLMLIKTEETQAVLRFV